MSQELVASILEDFERADIREELRVALRYLQKMTLSPESLTVEDARALRTAGLSREAAIEAIDAGFAFNLINRLADSFDFAVPTAERFAKIAPMLYKRGYKF